MLIKPVFADYQSGFKAYTHGDIDLALLEWQKVIESPPSVVHPQERAETLYAVAMLYWLGQGVMQDTTTSAGFLRQAADLNHAGAQSKLGYLFLIGQGVPANAFEARKWLEMSSRQGDADAQYNLAVMYRDGMGVEADLETALVWFEEAAANGDPVSAEVVAEYHRQGSLQTLAAPSEQESESQRDIQPDIQPDIHPDIQPDIQRDTQPDIQRDIQPDIQRDTQPDIQRDTQQATQVGIKAAAGHDAPEALVLPVSEPEPAMMAEAMAGTTNTPDPGYSPAKEPLGGMELQHAQSEAWILARDPAHYTIQVIALKSLGSMVNLIDTHTDMKPFAVYLQGEPEAPLYVLVQGDYASLDEARKVQQKFPRSLAKPKQLWIRRFEMVQGLIEKSQAADLTSGTNRGAN